MNPQRRRLLKEAHFNQGRLSMQTAYKIYSSPGAAKSAVKSLEMEGFLSKTGVPGVFKLEKLPAELKEELSEKQEGGVPG